MQLPRTRIDAADAARLREADLRLLRRTYLSRLDRRLCSGDFGEWLSWFWPPSRLTGFPSSF
jgi:hypothetical protein